MNDHIANEEARAELDALSEIYGDAIQYMTGSASTTISLALPLTTTETILLKADTQTHVITALPPAKLLAVLPATYPNEKPRFHIDAVFATTKVLQELADSLDSVFVCGEPVVFTWADAIITQLSNMLETAGEEAAYDYNLTLAHSAGSDDMRIAHAPCTATEKGSLIISFCDIVERKRLVNGHFRCSVCWETLPGCQCIQLSECKHIACRECVKGFWTSRIEEGRVEDGIVCPEVTCGGLPRVEEVRNVVETEMYDRYERFLLKRALEGRDVVSCVRSGCEGVAFRDESDERMVRCGYCSYIFCADCERTWHTGACKETESVKTFVQEYMSLDEEEREAYVKAMPDSEALKRKLAEVRCLTEMGGRPCPKCGMLIVKSGGCAHMVCSLCQEEFCWNCGEVLYSDAPGMRGHYRPGGCRMYEEEAEQTMHLRIWAWIFEHGEAPVEE